MKFLSKTLPHRLPPARRLALGLAAALVAGACAGGTPAPAPSATPAALVQPTEAEPCVQNEQGDACLPTAPESERVDLALPTFSNPTVVTNPLHPTRDLHSALLLGKSGGRPFRVEVTLLPDIKTIAWNGQQVQTLESQYVAFVDGRIHEVALDWYAQADDGSVWYLGEDVFNYEDGVVADTHGTWQAGRDGPPAMIMPAQPAVGDVYRPENIPGLVFEEVTVQGTGLTVDSPRGPLTGAIEITELHFDGSTENKTFAPGYGEFITGAGDDLEALALGVPADALAGPVPAELDRLFGGALSLFEAVQVADWDTASAAREALTPAWEAYAGGDVPPMLHAQMSAALDSLAAALDARDPAQAGLAALASLDLQLRYRPPTEIDLARFDLWLRQLAVDAAASDPAAVTGDVATLEWIRDRVAHTLAAPALSEVDGRLSDLRAAADSEDLAGAAAAAEQLRQVLAGTNAAP